MSDFAGKTIWITGASSGIGKALAEEFGRRGARLILSGRRIEALEALAADLAEPSLILPFDVTAFDALPDIVAEALAWQGHIDLLVNNAGITHRSLIVDTQFAVYRRLMEVDYLAPACLTQLLLPHMIERGTGRIAVIASVAGKIGVPLRSGYSAAKHAVLGWFDALRAEIEEAHGIGVSIVVPGSVQTDIARNALSARGDVRGHSDENVANGMAVDVVARQICEGLAAGTREIVVAEGQEAQAVTLRARDPETLFALIGHEGARLAAARAAAGKDWLPQPTRIR